MPTHLSTTICTATVNRPIIYIIATIKCMPTYILPTTMNKTMPILKMHIYIHPNSFTLLMAIIIVKMLTILTILKTNMYLAYICIVINIIVISILTVWLTIYMPIIPITTILRKITNM